MPPLAEQSRLVKMQAISRGGRQDAQPRRGRALSNVNAGNNKPRRCRRAPPAASKRRASSFPGASEVGGLVHKSRNIAAAPRRESLP